MSTEFHFQLALEAPTITMEDGDVIDNTKYHTIIHYCTVTMTTDNSANINVDSVVDINDPQRSMSDYHIDKQAVLDAAKLHKWCRDNQEVFTECKVSRNRHS